MWEVGKALVRPLEQVLQLRVADFGDYSVAVRPVVRGNRGTDVGGHGKSDDRKATMPISNAALEEAYRGLACDGHPVFSGRVVRCGNRALHGPNSFA
jgi:hypothetical protein